MNSYFFHGVVRPERAQLSIGKFALKFSHPTTGNTGIAEASVILNQVAVWITSDVEWDIFDLRNVVANLVQSNLDMIGYIRGYAYDLEITRVLNEPKKIDHVFGIDIPCLAEKGQLIDLNEELPKLRNIASGTNGMFINRCFNDLVSAMKRADDTAFYCYRAIESLRHHSAAICDLSSAKEPVQWEKFREIATCDKDFLYSIKDAADPSRHGKTTQITSDDRATLFTTTWEIVGRYIQNIPLYIANQQVGVSSASSL
jgi:hypothetical protein